MALSSFPNISKQIKLDDGTCYAFVYVTAAPSKPTFLLLHGFPCASYDWRHQIKSLSAQGFGVLVPDLLGYGDTDSPAEVEKYSIKRISGHIAEILGKEKIERVIGVGHDWGSQLLSRLYTWHSECLLGLVFVSVGYVEPSPIDVDAINQLTKDIFGYPLFGYWKFFNDEGAAKLCDDNPRSTTSLIYPQIPETWKEHLAPIGAFQSWIRQGKTSPRPDWLTEEEVASHEKILAQKGYTGPLNWYKAAIKGVDTFHEAELSEDRKFIQIPTLLVVSDKDYVGPPEIQTQGASKWAKHLQIVELNCGHWIPLELPDKLGQLLESFVDTVQGTGKF